MVRAMQCPVARPRGGAKTVEDRKAVRRDEHNHLVDRPNPSGRSRGITEANEQQLATGNVGFG